MKLLLVCIPIKNTYSSAKCSKVQLKPQKQYNMNPSPLFFINDIKLSINTYIIYNINER